MLAPRAAAVPDGWITVELGRRHLAHHPSLPCAVAGAGPRTVAVLGYCIDPDHPDRTEAATAELLLRCAGAVELAQACRPLGGRWVALSIDGDGGHGLHDAGGLRQICHATTDEGTWLASHDSLIATAAGLAADPAATAFASAGHVANNGWWPGDTTPTAGVRRLLPNHLVDLRTGRVERVWPRAEIAGRDLDEAAETMATLLKASVEAAAERFDLSLMLSGGWESRLILAACRDIAPQLGFLSFHTHQQGPEDSQIAYQLAERLGLDLSFDHTRPTPSDGFWADYVRNVPDARPETASTAEVLLERIGRRRVVMSGHMPIVHTHFRKVSPSEGRSFPVETALRLSKAGRSEFARAAFAAWRAGLPDPALGATPMDLYRWEQKWGGPWLTPWLLAYDWAWADCYLPLAHYPLIETAFGVGPPYRDKPSPELTIRTVERLWPDVLEVEINGGSRRSIPPLKRNTRVAGQRVKSELRYRKRQLGQLAGKGDRVHNP